MLKILEQIRIEQLIISISTLMLVSLLISGYKDKKNKQLELDREGLLQLIKKIVTTK